MKNINKIILAAVAFFGLASCSDDDYSPAVHGLEVTSAETVISAAGGTNTIETAATGVVSAYSNDSWLDVAVEGNKVNVTAGLNSSVESRHTTVVIKSTPEDSAIVNVTQYGFVFEMSAGSQITASTDEAQVLTYAVKANVPVSYSTTSDWFTITSTDDSLKVTLAENTTGHLRRGSIVYKAGNAVDSISVIQYDFDKDIAGDYALLYYNSNGELTYFFATLKEDTLSLPSLGLDVPVTFKEADCSVNIQAGSYAGSLELRGDVYHIYTVFMEENGEYWSAYSTSYSGSFVFDYDDEDGSTYADLTGSFGTYSIAYLIFEAFSKNEFAKDNDVSSVINMLYPKLIKMDDTEEAKMNVAYSKYLKLR